MKVLVKSKVKSTTEAKYENNISKIGFVIKDTNNSSTKHNYVQTVLQGNVYI